MLAALGFGLSSRTPESTGKENCAWAGCSSSTPWASISSDAGAEGDERHRLALADADHQAVGPDAGDGGVFHPIDGQQAAAALGERHGENAVVEIGGEDALHLGARGVDQALHGERILAVARERELRIAELT